MLFSIFSRKYDIFLGFRCVLHRFYSWPYVSFMKINIRMVKRTIFRPVFLIIATPEYSVYSAKRNSASNYDRNIILSPF